MTNPEPVVEQQTAPETAAAPVTAPTSATPLDLSSLTKDNPFPQPNPWAEPQAAPAPTQTAPASTAPAPAAATDEELPAGWRKHIEDLRKENAAYRTESNAKAEQAAQAAAEKAKSDILGIFKQAINPDAPEAELTPEQLLEQVQAKAAEDAAESAAKIAAAEQRAAAEAAVARNSKIELAVHTQAGGDVNVAALLDSTSFSQQLAKLDPSAEDFPTQLGAAIAAQVEVDPGRFRKATGLVHQVPRSSGSFEAGNAHQPAGEPSVEALLRNMHEGRNGHGRASRAFYNRPQ